MKEYGLKRGERAHFCQEKERLFIKLTGSDAEPEEKLCRHKEPTFDEEPPAGQTCLHV